MEFSTLHIGLALLVLGGLGLFLRAFLRGSQQLGTFWDRQRLRRAEAAATETERRSAQAGERS